MAAALGSTAPITATATLNYSTQDFEISVRYNSTATAWLTVTPSIGTTPANITVTADPSALPEGTYLAQIVAYVGPMHLAAAATITFVVAPAVVNRGGVAANPSSLTFIPKVSIDPQTITVSNAPGITESTRFIASTTTTSWLVLTQLNQSTPGAIKVQAYHAGLTAGVHTAAVIITASTGKSTIVPVTILVPQEPIGSTAVLSPAQRALTFNYQLNSTVNPTQTVYITTDSTQYVYFTATSTASWLGVAAAAWNAPAASASCFAPGLFYVAVNPGGLSAGVYQTSLKLTATTAAAVEIPITLNVTETPVLNASPSFVGFDTVNNVLSSTLSITASESMYFTATVSANTSWLKISTSGAIATNLPLDLTLTASTTNLPSGTYNGSVTLTGPSGSPILVIPVQFRVSSASTGANAVGFSSQKITFSAVGGDAVAPQYVGILSDLGSLDDFSLAVIGDGGWLNAELMSSPRGFVKVTVNSAVAPGAYSGSIQATSLRTGDTGAALVMFNLAARTLAVSPTQLTFQQAVSGAAIPKQELKFTSNRASDFRIVSHPAWAAIQTAGGLTTPATVVVSVNPGAMLPGRYEGVIEVSGPVTLSVPISLVLAAPAPPAVTPAAVTFAHQLGGPAPAAQMVSASNPTGPARFTVQAATSSGIDWLTADPLVGTTPAVIRLGINVARLTPGQHSGTLSIAIESTPAKMLTVSVTLTVTGSAVQVRDVLNAASLEPTPVSPGLLVTLTGLNLGPDDPVAARPSAAGAFPAELAGVRVSFDDATAPLLLVSREQINAIVPYAIYGRTSVRIQVKNGENYSIPIEAKAVDASPGIFTQGQTGRGAAAALNADFTLNSTLNPARRGSVVSVYLTGEGQTDPPGQDGRVINTDVRKPLLPVTATIGGQAAEVLYAGSAPQSVSGVCQVNVRIPEDIPYGRQTLEIQIGGAASQRGVTIDVQ